MKNFLFASSLLLTGCSTSPGLTPQQAAVADYVQASLPDSTASYQPVRWGKMTVFRASDVAALDLPEARRRYEATSAKLTKDSAGYVLVSTTARQFGTSPQDVAAVKQVYQNSLANRDSARVQLRRSIASTTDTTRVGYQLTHVFRANNAEGKLIADSAGFLVNLHGTVIANVPAQYFLFYSGPSNRARFLGIAPPAPTNEVILLDANEAAKMNAMLKDTLPQ